MTTTAISAERIIKLAKAGKADPVVTALGDGSGDVIIGIENTRSYGGHASGRGEAYARNLLAKYGIEVA